MSEARSAGQIIPTLRLTRRGTIFVRSACATPALATNPALQGRHPYPTRRQESLIPAEARDAISGSPRCRRRSPGCDQWIPTMPAQTQAEAPLPPSQIRDATASCSALVAR
jgi:hypothetical protein